MEWRDVMRGDIMWPGASWVCAVVLQTPSRVQFKVVFGFVF